MDDLIIDIYRVIADRDGRTDASIRLESIISAMTKEATIESLSEKESRINDLICNAVCVGQDDGFITGFKLSIKLLLSCLNEK